MSTDPLNRYRSIMDAAHAPDDLPDRVLVAARAQLADEPRTAGTEGTRACAETPAPQPTRPSAAPAFAVKRTRFKGFAIAACTVLALGLGATALALGPLNLTENGEAETTTAPSFANVFGLEMAEAAEIGQSVELSADESGITFAGTGGYDMRFGMNLTCVGEGITHLAYTIDGSDVHFMSLDMSQDALHPDMESPERFEVDYDNQNPEGLHREILVNMADPAMKEVSKQLETISKQLEATEDPQERAVLEAQRDEVNQKSTEINRAYYGGDAFLSDEWDGNAWLTEKVSGATQKLASATLSITATFTDGTTATKNYRVAPVEGFEEKFLAFITASLAPDHDESDPALTTPLFTITEIP